MSEAAGTHECPICAWPEPHHHTPEDVALRPAIDGARKAFEEHAREFMFRADFDSYLTGFWWAFDAEHARKDNGWAMRSHPGGPYMHQAVETMWQFWRMTWLLARGGVG